MKGRQELGSLSFFRGVADGTLQTLWEAGTVRSLPRGTVLIRAREKGNQLYVQRTGKSFVCSLTHHGHRRVLFILGPGELLNQNTLGSSTSAAWVEMLEPGEVFCVPMRGVSDCMRTDFSLTLALLAAQERKLWRLEHQLKNTVSSLYLDRKLSAKLWKLARDFGLRTERGIEIDVDFSVSFLADMMGVPRETVSRLRNTLVGYGFIEVNGKRITVVDSAGMARFYKTGELPRKEK